MIRNIIIYVVVCIILLASFKIPEVLIKREDTNVEIAIYNKENNKGYLDVDTENIYLVKAIHDIEQRGTVKISKPYAEYIVEATDQTLKNILKEELKKLNEYKIVKNTGAKENEKYTIGLINKNYQNDKEAYTVNNITILNRYILDVESKTGKIIYILFDKNNLYDEDKMGILQNYIKYLNLYIIDDWEEEIDETNKTYTMKSEKADVRVSLAEVSDKYVLSFHTLKNFKVIDTN